MIQIISKVQKIASGTNSGITINTSLPISIKVAQKIGYNRYILEFKNKKLNTKSMKSLKIGGRYWGEISSGKENIIIQNLYEKPDFGYSALDDGLNLIEKITKEKSLDWFYEYVFSALADSSDKQKFEICTDMLFALQSKVIHIPFVYEGNFGLFQMKKEEDKSRIYLIFSNFAPLAFELENSQILSISTPFKKVARLLQEKFECDVRVCAVSEIYTPKSAIIDFKG